MKKIRWGVLSTARIGTETVIPAMQLGEYCTITAIASRQLEKAQAAARQLGIKKAYGSYEELLSDPDIDAVYIYPAPQSSACTLDHKCTEGRKTRFVRETHWPECSGSSEIAGRCQEVSTPKSHGSIYV
jgi:hypothetical protein